jgi:hypothetical protein
MIGEAESTAETIEVSQSSRRQLRTDTRYRVRAPRARIRLMPATRLNHQPSTRNNSTTMAPIDDAIAAIDA